MCRANSTRIMKKQIKRAKKLFSHQLGLFITRAFRLAIKPFSLFFRRVFEQARIKQALGILITLSVFFIAVFPTSISAVQTGWETSRANPQIEPETIRTQRSLRLPVETFALSQGYHFLHPGIDLAATKGSPVYAIMGGQVSEIKRDRFGFGNHVLVDHGNGLKSLYAHLSKIEVKEGETITNQTIVGLLGSTGWSTGPHLHLQVWQDNKLVNPKTFFEGYFGKRLASII